MPSITLCGNVSSRTISPIDTWTNVFSRKDCNFTYDLRNARGRMRDIPDDIFKSIPGVTVIMTSLVHSQNYTRGLSHQNVAGNVTCGRKRGAAMARGSMSTSLPRRASWQAAASRHVMSLRWTVLFPPTCSYSTNLCKLDRSDALHDRVCIVHSAEGKNAYDIHESSVFSIVSHSTSHGENFAVFLELDQAWKRRSPSSGRIEEVCKHITKLSRPVWRQIIDL